MQFFSNSASTARELSKGNVKIVCSVPMALFPTYFLFGPGGGHGPHSRKLVEDKVKSSGKSLIEVADEVRDMSAPKCSEPHELRGFSALHRMFGKIDTNTGRADYVRL